MKSFAVLYTIIPEKPLRPLREPSDLEAAASPINPCSSIFIEAPSTVEAEKLAKDYVALKYGYSKDKIFIFMSVGV